MIRIGLRRPIAATSVPGASRPSSWRAVMNRVWKRSPAESPGSQPEPPESSAAPSESVLDLIRATRKDRAATMRAKARVEEKRERLEAAGMTGHFVYDAMAGHGVRPVRTPPTMMPPATTEGES